MEITGVETVAAGKFLFVRVHTDEGIVGVGESGTWGYLDASRTAVETFERYLTGKDPLRREHHWQYLYRNCHFRGAAIMGALSAIDVALWDIAGKWYGVPVYELLGGKVRDRARVYARVMGETTEDLLERCHMAKTEGFTAVGHLSPFLDEPRSKPYFETHAGRVSRAVERVEQFREAVGTGVDLCLEFHRRLDPKEAVPIIRAIESAYPIFVEDPIRPDNFDAMATVAARSPVPIATGERLHTIHEFEMLFERDALEFARPDVCLVGGLTGAKKVAALAESRYVGVVPHNPLGPVSTAACLQLAACIPNFELLEYPYRPETGEAAGHDLAMSSFACEDGFIPIPTDPGLGVELDEEAIAASPPRTRDIVTRLHADGSVVDQ